MTITADTTVGKLAAEHPMVTRVFHRHGIDFCCGGGRPLHEACARKGVDVNVLLADIRAELDTTTGTVKRWDTAPLTDLIDHIVETYHKPLAEELPRLQEMAAKVLKVHGDKFPEVIPPIHSTFVELQAELENHMAKEEQILFPMIREGNGAMAGDPVAVMENEHENAGAALGRLRQLTGNYEVPEYACNTWRALWHGLAELEETMHEHIHLENNILFPRALAQ